MSKMEQLNLFVIEANPTKELFVHMLVRDLTLRDAIGDLVDNSVDGAKRLRPDADASRSRNRLEPDGKYNGLTVEIDAKPDRFSIVDNCGGIASAIARDYAFRFGRPKDMPDTPGSVGQFGIGMKRALFKLGTKFEIRSTSRYSKFSIVEDVREWILKDEWTFRFKDLDERREGTDEPFPTEQSGTAIRVESLREDTKASFQLDKFIDNLRREIEKEQLYNIHRGFSIGLLTIRRTKANP